MCFRGDRKSFLVGKIVPYVKLDALYFDYKFLSSTIRRTLSDNIFVGNIFTCSLVTAKLKRKLSRSKLPIFLFSLQVCGHENCPNLRSMTMLT